MTFGAHGPILKPIPYLAPLGEIFAIPILRDSTVQQANPLAEWRKVERCEHVIMVGKNNPGMESGPGVSTQVIQQSALERNAASLLHHKCLVFEASGGDHVDFSA